MRIDRHVSPKSLLPAVDRLFTLACGKIRDLDRTWKPSAGTPVFTVKGRYATRGWTEWTQGFQYGCMILAYDVTNDAKLLDRARELVVDRMLPHVTHIGVHDHGFNNLSTYGNLLRLMDEGAIKDNAWERRFYAMAVAASGAVQASRWSGVPVKQPSPHAANSTSLGYVYSFNGPHSLFVDTMRTIRILGAAWSLGHVLMHENDKKADLLKRAVLHALTTSQYIVFHGDSGQTYDVRGRTAHEAIFNRNDGNFRCRSSQQGYSPFSTWTRGLAWALLGYAEQLEFIKTLSASVFKASVGLDKAAVLKVYERCARDTDDHYIHDCAALDGITYWDDGAPGMAKLGDWRQRPADPYNDHEPVDSSASAIAAQGLIRLGRTLGGATGKAYLQAGLTVAQTLLAEPYLSTKPAHQGLLLHSIYHRPNNWDHIPKGSKIPCGESSMWGDYHLLEMANLIRRMATGGAYPVFFPRLTAK
ncbi:MAG: glycosyl hydrolase [Phycisphaeraceae bacterium]|nr:glycosyl hydrolase [Phycisphaeraceae bacterium]